MLFHHCPFKNENNLNFSIETFQLKTILICFISDEKKKKNSVFKDLDQYQLTGFRAFSD